MIAARLLLAFFAAAAMAAPAVAADLTVSAASRFVAEFRINGHPVRLRVDPEAPGFIVLNPSAARRIGLRRSLLPVEAIVGPVHLEGATKVAAIEHGATRFSRRVAWLDADAAEDADGLVNPANLPFDRVTMALGPAHAGEAEHVLAMNYSREYGLRFPLAAGNRIVHFLLTTNKPRSMATAAAGGQLAAAFDGAWTGDAFETHIEYGVRRPVRPMRLGRPVTLQGLAVDDFLVRTTDHRGATSLPGDSGDPAEIVVTGPSAQGAVFMVTLGLDRLAACASMTYDRAAGTMTLRCRPGRPA